MHNVSSFSYKMWQYRAYVMDSVSSDQAIIISHRHAYIYYLYAPCIHCVPHHPNLVSFLFIPSLYSLFLIRRIFHLLIIIPITNLSHQWVWFPLENACHVFGLWPSNRKSIDIFICNGSSRLARVSALMNNS